MSFAFVPPARKLAADIEFAGCPMKKGQMVLMPLWSANRDSRVFPNAHGGASSTGRRTATSRSAPDRIAAPAPTSPGASC